MWLVCMCVLGVHVFEHLQRLEEEAMSCDPPVSLLHSTGYRCEDGTQLLRCGLEI